MIFIVQTHTRLKRGVITNYENSRLNPGVSPGLLRDGLHIRSRSRSPSSLVCPSMDSSFVGGESDVQAGLEESVRYDSLPPNKRLCIIFFRELEIFRSLRYLLSKYILDQVRIQGILVGQMLMTVEDSTEMV